MLDARALDAYYKTLTDEELLKLRVDGGLTAEAEQRLGKELVRRGLTPEEAKRKYAPEWFDKADVGTVGVIVLQNGERIIADPCRIFASTLYPDDSDLPVPGREKPDSVSPLLRSSLWAAGGVDARLYPFRVVLYVCRSGL